MSELCLYREPKKCYNLAGIVVICEQIAALERKMR